jgi:plastocyanin
MSKNFALLSSVVAIALGVAACGGSSGSSSTAAGTTSSAAAAPTSSAPAATGTSSAAATSSSTGGAAASGQLTLMAMSNGQLMFDKKTLAAKAGTVTVAFTNNSPEAHNLTIQKGTSGAVVGATPTFTGGTKTLSVKLAAGTYTFYCSVPGHRAAGMQGTLTVS